MQALLAYVSPKCKGVRVAEGQHERGLYAVTAAKKGDVLLTVPKAVSLVVDFDNGNLNKFDCVWICLTGNCATALQLLIAEPSICNAYFWHRRWPAFLL